MVPQLDVSTQNVVPCPRLCCTRKRDQILHMALMKATQSSAMEANQSGAELDSIHTERVEVEVRGTGPVDLRGAVTSQKAQGLQWISGSFQWFRFMAIHFLRDCPIQKDFQSANVIFAQILEGHFT